MARRAAKQVVQVVNGSEPRETREEKFRRLATSRTNHTLYHVGVLGNLSNRNTYRYTDEEVALMFGTIEKALADQKVRFNSRKKPDFHL